MTRDELTGFLTSLGIDPGPAGRLAGLAAELAGRTARPDLALLEASLRSVTADYVINRLHSGVPGAGDADPDASEKARLVDAVMRNLRVLLSNMMACGLYDLTKLGIGWSKLNAAAAAGSADLAEEMELRLGDACAGLPDPLVDRTLAELPPEVTGRLQDGIEATAIRALEGALGGAPLPDHVRTLTASSLLFALFYDVHPFGPKIIAATAARA